MALLQLLLEFLHLLGLRLEAACHRLPRHEHERVGSCHNVFSERIDIGIVGERHLQRIDGGHAHVFQPIGDGVVARRALHQEVVVGIEIDALEHRHHLRGRREIEAKVFWHVSLRFQEMAVGVFGLESQEHQIVGHVMRVADGFDGVVVNRVAPNRVVAHIRECRRPHNGFERRQHLAAREHEIAVNVLEGVDAVSARRNALDGKETAPVGSRHAVEGLGGKSRVGRVAMQSDQNALERFEVLSGQDVSRHLHRVERFAR